MNNEQKTPNPKKILSVKDLSKYFTKNGKIAKVLDELTFDIYEGDFFGVIGESGSGKSTTGKCVIRLYESNGGVITFLDKIINNKHITKSTRTWLCKNMQMIFQDPMSSLNPRKNVLSLISEPIKINGTLKKEAKDLINICNEINPYFGHTFVWESFALNNEYLIPYLNEINKGIQTTIDELEALTQKENPSLDVLTDEMNSIYVRLEVLYTTQLEQLFTLVAKTKELIFINHDKLINHQIEDTETAYYEAKIKCEYEKEVYEKSAEFIKIREQKEKLEQEKKALEDKVKLSYEEQNSVFISSLLADYKSKATLYRQKMQTTTDLFYYSLNKIKVAIAEDITKILKEVQNDIYLSVEEISEFSEFINKKVSEKYSHLITEITLLSGLDEHINEHLIDYLNQENKTLTLTADLSKWYTSYTTINEMIDKKIDEDFLSTSNSIKKVVNDLTVKSNNTKESIENEIKNKSLEIEKIENQLKEQYKNYKNSDEQTHNKETYQSSKEELEEKKKNILHFIELDDEYFEKNCQGLVDKQNENIKNLLKTNKKLSKALKESSKKMITSIKKSSLNETDSDFKINFLNFKNELKNRNNAISACAFEQESVLSQLELYISLRSKSKWVVWSNYNYLKNVIVSEKVFAALNEVGLKNEHAFRYPHEFSGGQRQRIVIARSLISKPKFIIADEPISALDVSIQAQVVNIMKKLSVEQGITFMFIAHDLSMVNFLCNRLIILHKGKIVEKGDTNEIFNHPVHPYTISLIKASPELSKIHVDLSSFEFDSNYDKNYTIHNKPKFYKIENEKDHYVFCSEEQFNKWTKK